MTSKGEARDATMKSVSKIEGEAGEVSPSPSKSPRKIYGSECMNPKCLHRMGVHYISLETNGVSCDGYVRKDQPNFDGKKCGCNRYERPTKNFIENLSKRKERPR